MNVFSYLLSPEEKDPGNGNVSGVLFTLICFLPCAGQKMGLSTVVLGVFQAYSLSVSVAAQARSYAKRFRQISLRCRKQ